MKMKARCTLAGGDRFPVLVDGWTLRLTKISEFPFKPEWRVAAREAVASDHTTPGRASPL